MMLRLSKKRDTYLSSPSLSLPSLPVSKFTISVPFSLFSLCFTLVHQVDRYSQEPNNTWNVPHSPPGSFPPSPLPLSLISSLPHLYTPPLFSLPFPFYLPLHSLFYLSPLFSFLLPLTFSYSLSLRYLLLYSMQIIYTQV
jgi:hypothetical protein